MKKSNKNIIKSVFVFFSILLLSISIVMANNSYNNGNYVIDKEKIYHEIKYFDSEFINFASLLSKKNEYNNFDIEWQELEYRCQILYSYWNSAILDFNYLNIEKEELVKFGKDLDELLVALKNYDRNEALSNLVELYNKLVIYSQSIDYKEYSDILLTKYNLLISYSIMETGNWTLAHEYILKASKHIYEVVKYTDVSLYKQYNINQAYIAVKEMENLINIKNTEVFFIKYNIAIQKLENI